MDVRYYLTEQGANPVQVYLNGLPSERFAAILALVRDLKANGLEGTTVERRHIAGKVWEFKPDPDRIFWTRFSLRGEEMLMFLHAYKKQGQKAPKKEIWDGEKKAGRGKARRR